MNYVEIKTKTCSVRVYDTGRVAYKPFRHHRWRFLKEAGTVGPPHRRSRLSVVQGGKGA